MLLRSAYSGFIMLQFMSAFVQAEEFTSYDGTRLDHLEKCLIESTLREKKLQPLKQS
jgi:hypothetical protein